MIQSPRTAWDGVGPATEKCTHKLTARPPVDDTIFLFFIFYFGLIIPSFLIYAGRPINEPQTHRGGQSSAQEK